MHIIIRLTARHKQQAIEQINKSNEKGGKEKEIQISLIGLLSVFPIFQKCFSFEEEISSFSLVHIQVVVNWVYAIVVEQGSLHQFFAMAQITFHSIPSSYFSSFCN